MPTATLEAPVEPVVAGELIGLWQQVFSTSYDEFRSVLAGEELPYNQNIIFLAREHGRLAGTAQLTIARATPELGGLGEAGVATEFRGRGIGSTLCEMALREFERRGGRALFLATSNPAAFRVYHRLGWRNLGLNNVMAHVSGLESPEAFLVEYYRGAEPVKVAEGTPADRIAMIPLLITPHEWHVLDFNLKFYSTRYMPQNGCLGLYPAYAALRHDGRGTWFAARGGGGRRAPSRRMTARDSSARGGERGRLLGLATVKMEVAGLAQVDGFTHPNHKRCWHQLLQAALRWAADRAATRRQTTVSAIDEEKKSLYSEFGFRALPPTGEFQTSRGPVAALPMEIQFRRSSGHNVQEKRVQNPEILPP